MVSRTLTTFLLGLDASQPNCAFLETNVLYERVGHNTGNLAFHFAIQNQIAGLGPAVPWGAPTSTMAAAGDIAVVPCANQLGPHADYQGLAQKFASLPISFVAIGLGAQAGTYGEIPVVPKGTLDWVRAMAERSVAGGPNIALRGEFSLSVLEHYGLGNAAVVLGCPSLFINPAPDLGARLRERFAEPKRIAVAAGHQGWKHLARLEASLTAIVKETHGSYVGQSPLEMIMLTRSEAESLSVESLTACRDYACPDMSLEEFIRWANAYGDVFFDVSAWMEHYRHFDLVIGTRIHGVMLALQAGVPGICIAHDSRTVELCRTMLVPYVLAKDVLGGVRRKDLRKLMEFDVDAFDANRRALASRYLEFLRNNSIPPTAVMEGIALPRAEAAEGRK